MIQKDRTVLGANHKAVNGGFPFWNFLAFVGRLLRGGSCVESCYKGNHLVRSACLSHRTWVRLPRKDFSRSKLGNCHIRQAIPIVKISIILHVRSCKTVASPYFESNIVVNLRFSICFLKIKGSLTNTILYLSDIVSNYIT